MYTAWQGASYLLQGGEPHGLSRRQARLGVQLFRNASPLVFDGFDEPRSNFRRWGFCAPPSSYL